MPISHCINRPQTNVEILDPLLLLSPSWLVTKDNSISAKIDPIHGLIKEAINNESD
jgi:hypothetical protein